ncbi:MAG: hypothetical protein AB7I41_04160 [Candidatus Sericytochromatia bacterium]
MRKLVLGLSSLSLALVACQPPGPVNGISPVRLNAATAIGSRAITDSRFSYSADRSELTVILVHDSGETVEYSAVRRPLDGLSVQAQTTVKRNGSVVSSARTTPSEAQLVLKTAANNGWQEVYKDLKERYRLAGLVN